MRGAREAVRGTRRKRTPQEEVGAVRGPRQWRHPALVAWQWRIRGRGRVNAILDLERWG